MTTKLHPLQAFEFKTISRSLINEAEYNPRTMPEDNYRGLKKSLKKAKLREALVWNEKTSNLVGGHQRLRVLDEEWLRKNETLDYQLTVCVINVDIKEEKEINVALNNPRL